MVVSPRCSSHDAGIDVVGHDVGVIGKNHLADRALAALGHHFLVQQLSHFRVRANFGVSARMEGIVNSANSHLWRTFAL
jgi:hypothetical protein